MAEVAVHSDWIVRLETEELRLVLKALGGRLADEREQQEAKDLGDKLTRIRARVTLDSLRQADKLLENATCGRP